jgi:hypothetical protein
VTTAAAVVPENSVTVLGPTISKAAARSSAASQQHRVGEVPVAIDYPIRATRSKLRWRSRREN